VYVKHLCRFCCRYPESECRYFEIGGKVRTSTNGQKAGVERERNTNSSCGVAEPAGRLAAKIRNTFHDNFLL